MKKGGFLIYIRTSTVKQGTEGVSLEVQEREAMNLARQKGLAVRKVVTEMETAAKSGRPKFNWVINELKAGRADGLILHKIDRGSRNSQDWADISYLLDRGIEVYSVKESVDLQSRGGRLVGDMLAAVAADYVRNLREETKKGLVGRLKQGVWPFPAPIGYVNQGAGKLKTVEPVRGPLVLEAFELYATGQYTFKFLRKHLYEAGLRTVSGKPLSKNGLTFMFKNPFYIGLMRLRSTGELFVGEHQKLVPASVFERVQDVLQGRARRSKAKHSFTYSRSIWCSGCKYRLVGETRKGHVYYRCHSKECAGTAMREERVTEAMQGDLSALLTFFATYPKMVKVLGARMRDSHSVRAQAIAALRVKLSQVDFQENAAVDAVIGGLIDKDTFIEKKNQLLGERQALNEQLILREAGALPIDDSAQLYLGLVNDLRDKLFLQSPLEIRAITKRATLDFVAHKKCVCLQWKFPFQQAVDHAKLLNSAHYQDSPRTLEEWADLFMSSDATSNVPTSPCHRASSL